MTLLGATGCILSSPDVTGASASGKRLERMKKSSQWSPESEHFTNSLRRVDGPFFEMMRKFFFGGSKHREPKSKIPVVKRAKSDFAQTPDSGLRVSWMGHSSFIIEIEGARILIDPVWSERASPFSWAGPKRFYQPPITLNELPSIDAVIISHDHYDHLDRDTVVALAKNRAIRWFVPLGVGAHIEKWGVASSQIEEMDWWESSSVKNVEITATPSRHFSGRSIFFTDQNATLWAGWSIKGPTRSVFYSGDTALHPEFDDIGKRLGPFDLTLMEAGAYNELWADVHLGPEQAVLAHHMVKGNVMMPVHWGLFDLALHGWTEPAERTIRAAKSLGVNIAIIRPGASFDISEEPGIDRWWPQVPWQTVEAAPAWSSSVQELKNRYMKLSQTATTSTSTAAP